MKIPHEWHKSFFRNSFYNPASKAAVEKAPAEAAFVLKQLRLKKGSGLLDLCCGPGRHAVPLAKQGLVVTGYDFSSEYLKEAAARARKAKVKLELVRGDMRKLWFKNEFDAVINLFTSFGYFQKYSDDMKVLKGVARALKPGGKFFLDLVNGEAALRNSQRKSWSKMPDGSFHLTEFVPYRDGAFNSWTVLDKGRAKTGVFFVRLYNRRSISAALCAAGLRPVRFWGDFNGSRSSSKSVRLIVLATKPT